MYLLFALAVLAPGKETPEAAPGVEQRTGHGGRVLAGAKELGKFELPPGIPSLERISEDGAVAIALWNNSALQASLARIGLAKAELVDAGLLSNPVLQMLLPVSPKPFELLLQWPIERWWQRPRRMKAAETTLRQVSESLVQDGLDTALAARFALIDLWLAGRRAELTRDSWVLRKEIAQLTSKRLDAGDISEAEANLARIDASSFEDLAARAEGDVQTARERLRLALGLRGDATPVEAEAAESRMEEPPPWEQLVEKALSWRPDLRAAELEVEAAMERARWERSRVLALVGPMLSVKGVGDHGNRAGPGVWAELPVFHRNQGGARRADEQVRMAAFRYAAMKDSIEAETREARARLLQEKESLARLRKEIVPAVRQSIELAGKAYSAGDASHLFVLEASRQLFEVEIREAEAEAGLHRAWARLERSVGGKL